jgi:hypothetical protein
MLIPFAVILSTSPVILSEAKNLALPPRVDSAKHLALLLVGGKVQSEILRSAALRMTAWKSGARCPGAGFRPSFSL